MIKKYKILIVDDEIPIGRYVKKSLEQNENCFEVNHFSNPIKAIEYAKNNIFDLLILDLMMPEINGFEVATKFRKLKEYQKTPIVIYSSMTRKEDKLRALNSPIFAEGYISKDNDSIDFLTHQIRSIFWRKEVSQMTEKIDFANKLGKSISHEASQDLLAISGFNEVIKNHITRDSFEKEKVLQYVNKINTSVQNLKKIIEYLRNITNIETKDIGAGDVIIKVKDDN